MTEDNGKKLDVCTGEREIPDIAQRIANNAIMLANSASSFMEAMFANRHYKPGETSRVRILEMVAEAFLAADAVLRPVFAAQSKIDNMLEESEEEPKEIH